MQFSCPISVKFLSFINSEWEAIIIRYDRIFLISR